VGAIIAIVALVVAAGLGLTLRRVNGRFRAPRPTSDPVLADLGVTPQTPLTLLQFSSAFCAPCRVARRICAELAGGRDGVAHLEVDAESHLDEVRALGVWRTPTVLVVDATGRIAFRLGGAPTRAGLAAAVESLAPQAVA